MSDKLVTHIDEPYVPSISEEEQKLSHRAHAIMEQMRNAEQSEWIALQESLNVVLKELRAQQQLDRNNAIEAHAAHPDRQQIEAHAAHPDRERNPDWDLDLDAEFRRHNRSYEEIPRERLRVLAREAVAGSEAAMEDLLLGTNPDDMRGMTPEEWAKRLSEENNP